VILDRYMKDEYLEGATEANGKIGFMLINLANECHVLEERNISEIKYVYSVNDK